MDKQTGHYECRIGIRNAELGVRACNPVSRQGGSFMVAERCRLRHHLKLVGVSEQGEVHGGPLVAAVGA